MAPPKRRRRDPSGRANTAGTVSTSPFRSGRIVTPSRHRGPPLVFSARWIAHLEDEWELPDVRRFSEELARSYRVVRYDRIGVGLSTRDLPGPPSVESEAHALGTVLAAATAHAARLGLI